MSKKLNPDRELVIQKYVVEDKSLKLTAKELGCGRTTLSRYIKIYKIKKRNRYAIHRKNIKFSNYLLVKAYKNKSAEQLALEQGCGKSTIFRYLRALGVNIKSGSEILKSKFIGKGNPFYGKNHTHKTRSMMSRTRIDRELSKGKNNYNYIDGRATLPYPPEFNQILKDKIRKRDNYTCQNCGMTEEESLIVVGANLHVHHIDYDKQNCKEDNLVTTCGNCNLRANFNRPYWQEFFTNKIGQVKHDNV